MNQLLPTRALTLWQPWAWLVASGFKPIENRPRGFSHKSFRGDFWIHAAQESSASISSWPLAERLCSEILGPGFLIPSAHDLSFMAIIGRATIVGAVMPVGHALHEPGVPWHFPDQYGFKVERAQLLSRPVPCRGYQGFWNVPVAVLAELEAKNEAAE